MNAQNENETGAKMANKRCFLPVTAVEQPCLFLSAYSSWGSPGQSWAGYAAKIRIGMPHWLGQICELEFISQHLGQCLTPTSFVGAEVDYDPVTFGFRCRAEVPGFTGSDYSIITIGFEAAGVFDPDFAIVDCSINGHPCSVGFVDEFNALRAIDAFRNGGQYRPSHSQPHLIQMNSGS